VLSLLLVALAGVIFAVVRPGSPGAFDRSQYVLETDATYYEWLSVPCLVDANGDGMLDVVGRVGSPPSEEYRLQVVDGASGAPLWSGATHPSKASVVCLSPRYFGVDNTDFTLALRPARSPDKVLTLTLQDHASRIGNGPGCFLIEMMNGRTRAVSEDGKPLAVCPTKTVELTAPWLSTERGTLMVAEGAGGMHYELKAEPVGTPFISVVARAGTTVVWEVNLRYTAVRGTSMVVTPEMLVVYAHDPTEDKFGVIIGLDLHSGRERYALRQGSPSSGDLSSFQYNNRYVIAHWRWGLHAYEPSTGKPVWHVGSGGEEDERVHRVHISAFDAGSTPEVGRVLPARK
jgi:hypothetical protein